MKSIIIILLTILLFSCRPKIIKTNIEIIYFNGYKDTISEWVYIDYIYLDKGCLWTGMKNTCCGVRTYKLLNNQINK